MGRAPCCDKNSVKKGPWAPEEDAKLKDYIETHGFAGNWIALPPKIGLKRCGKSCRLRWLNYLRPNIKHGGFTEEEDKIICNLYISIGSRWSVIAAQLPGRTDNDIKNYWNTRLKKKMFGKRKQTLLERLSIAQGYQNLQHDGNNHGVQDYSSPFLQNLSNSAIERLQLHMHLQSSISFYNNPSMFPKLNLNPLQENIIQNIQPMNNDQKFDTIYQQSCVSNNMKFHALEDTNGLSFNSLGDQKATTIVTGHDGFLNGGENGGFLPSPGGISIIPEFEYQGMEGDSSKDQLLWWVSEFDTNSASSNSLDSASHTYQSGEMNQDFIGVGYSNINNTTNI